MPAHRAKYAPGVLQCVLYKITAQRTICACHTRGYRAGCEVRRCHPGFSITASSSVPPGSARTAAMSTISHFSRPHARYSCTTAPTPRGRSARSNAGRFCCTTAPTHSSHATMSLRKHSRGTCRRSTKPCSRTHRPRSCTGSSMLRRRTHARQVLCHTA